MHKVKFLPILFLVLSGIHVLLSSCDAVSVNRKSNGSSNEGEAGRNEDQDSKKSKQKKSNNKGNNNSGGICSGSEKNNYGEPDFVFVENSPLARYIKSETRKNNLDETTLQINYVRTVDSEKRLIKEQMFKDGDLVNPISTLNFTYNKDGRLEREDKVNLTVTYKYSENGQLILKREEEKAQPERYTEVTYTYNEDGLSWREVVGSVGGNTSEKSYRFDYATETIYLLHLGKSSTEFFFARPQFSSKLQAYTYGPVKRKDEAGNDNTFGVRECTPEQGLVKCSGMGPTGLYSDVVKIIKYCNLGRPYYSSVLKSNRLQSKNMDGSDSDIFEESFYDKGFGFLPTRKTSRTNGVEKTAYEATPDSDENRLEYLYPDGSKLIYEFEYLKPAF